MITVDKMQQYLKIAIEIESQLYALQTSKSRLNNEISKLNSVQYYDDIDCALNEITYNQESVRDYIKENYTGFFKSLFKLKLFDSKIISIIAILILLVFISQIFIFAIGMPIVLFESSEPIMFAGSAVLAVVVLAVIVLLLEFIYKKIISSGLKKDFNSNRFRHNRLREQSEALYAKNQRLIKGYNVQLNAVNNELQEINILRNKFYSENILPPQYRTLVAVSTMYPWLQYKRCTEIYGHGGLFDTYEYDLKLGTIIGNLQQINAKMDIVIRNQQTLIQEVRRGNEIAGDILRHVKSIENTQERIASDVSDIKTSSQITAMQSSRAAMYAEYEYYRNH